MPYVHLARHTKQNGIQVLQVVDWANEPDWDEGAQLPWENGTYSENMRMVYLIGKVSIDHIPYLQQMVQPYDVSYDSDGNTVEGANYAPRTGGLPGIDWLADALGMSDLRERIESGESLPILDMTGFSTDVWVMDNTAIDFEYRDDDAVWTSGTASIKSSGGDYTTIASWAADLGTQTANVVGRVDSALTETAQASLNNDNATYDCRISCSSYHNGNPNAGYKVTANHTNTDAIALQCDGSGGSITIDCINLVVPNSTNMYGIRAIGITNQKTVTIYNCLVGRASGGSNVREGIANTDADANPFNVYNCMVWYSVGRQLLLVSGSTQTVENCLLYSDETGSTGINASSATATIRNCIVLTVGNAFVNVTSNVVGRNNYSSGTTGEDGDFGGGGSGNITSGTTAVLQSVDPTNAAFGKPVASSAIDGAATTPTLWTVDIAGNPYNGTIGAHQIAAAIEFVLYFDDQARVGINAGRFGVMEG